MENDSSGVLPLVKAQPLSPQALIHCRPSSSLGFSVNVLIAPRAPAFTRARLKSAGLRLVSTNLPLRFSRAILTGSVSLNSTTSLVTPSGGVGPLHMPSEVGVFL